MTKKKEYTGLSYSSANLLLNCEQKYAFYKVLETKPDDDIEENTDALRFGSAFHDILELTKHTPKDIMPTFEKVMTAYEFDSNVKGCMEAMLISYLKKHAGNPFSVVACETEIRTDEYLGYVDAIAANEKGEWIIIDLKTAARLFGAVEKKLPDDFQLNIYTKYKEHLAKAHDLDVDKFVGCSYRVTLKSKLKQKKTEDRKDYINRMLGQTISHDFFIPASMLNPEKFGELHNLLYKKSMTLRKGKVKPLQNFGYCEAFFRPCSFYSQCHSHKWSDEVNLEI